MSSAKTLEKVLRLIALSSSPSEEEARTSSVLACRLIREHGLLVILPNGSNGTATEPDPPRDKTSWSPSPGRNPPRSRPAPQPRHKQPPQSRTTKDTYDRGNAKPRLIVLNYRGVCSTCGKYVLRGSKAWWRPGKGIAHQSCSFDSLYS